MMKGLLARLTDSAAVRPVRWRAFNRIFLGTFFGLLVGVYVFILLIDPYGVVPFHLPLERHIAGNQRQMFPQILRTGNYDSLVVGTSTSRLLDPIALDRRLGGHFANFAMPSMSAWEQYQAADFLRRVVAAPRILFVGLDHSWCYQPGEPTGGPPNGEFPGWAFDDNPWNDFLYLLNGETLEVAGRVVSRLLGRSPEKVRRDGFEIFVPPESQYDFRRAEENIWGGAGPHRIEPVSPPVLFTDAERNALVFPALAWLDAGLSGLPAARKVLAFMPVHVAFMPQPGSRRAAVEAECKAQIAAIARRRGATVIDWEIASPLTTNDANYWDVLHYRLPVAYRLIEDLGRVVVDGQASADGSYRILVP